MVITIEQAIYKGEYKVEFVFSDGEKKVVDLYNFLSKSKNPMTRKYLNLENFQSFYLEYGDVVWNDYELCFPVWDLHEGEIS